MSLSKNFLMIHNDKGNVSTHRKPCLLPVNAKIGTFERVRGCHIHTSNCTRGTPETVIRSEN